MKQLTVVRILNETEFHDFLDDMAAESEPHPMGWQGQVMEPEAPREDYWPFVIVCAFICAILVTILGIKAHWWLQ